MQPFITYIDGNGNPHPALLITADQLHPGFVNLAFIDNGEPKKLIAVAHSSHESKDQNVPLHCWKEADIVSAEDVDKMVADIAVERKAFHEQIDQLQAENTSLKKRIAESSDGNYELAAQVKAFESQLNQAMETEGRLTKKVADLETELAATTEGRDKALQELADAHTSVPATETKHYADGTSATGPGPLPDHSPTGSPEAGAETPTAEVPAQS